MATLRRRIQTKLEPIANRVKKRTGIGNSWRLEPGVACVASDLVFPLRYDIAVRQRFFELYADHRDGYDEEEFLELVREHPYRVWIEHILVPRNHNEAVGDPVQIDAVVRDRVRKSVAIYESILANGFDTAQPIVPLSADQILNADSGRPVTGSLFAGDGCHRLACLMALGYEELPADYIKIKRYRRLRPIDNTARLVGHFDISDRWLTGLG